MKDIKVFNHNQFGELTVIEHEGQAWFDGNQVARILGYINPRDVLAKRCKGVAKHDTLKNKGGYPLTIIPEPDLYRLIIGSQLPGAEKFERWVFEEVLPSIRKHGGYILDQDKQSPEEILANAVLVAQSVIKEKEKELQQKNLQLEEQKPKVEVYDKFISTENNYSFKQFADMVDVEGLGRNNMMKLFREKEYLNKKNEPYRRYIEQGLLASKVTVLDNLNATVITPLITPKGITYFKKKLIDWGLM